MKQLKAKTNPFDEQIKDEKKVKTEEKSIAGTTPTEAKPTKKGRGRPRISPDSPNYRTRFILWIPQATMEQVRQCASDSHVTISKYIVDCLIEKNAKANHEKMMAKLEALEAEEIAKAKTAEEVETIMIRYANMRKKS